MKVTCPKCQFENQADSSRVVCARCATIIEVRMDQGFDSNGKRQTARLPFTSGGLSGGGQSLGSQRFNDSDVYATRIGDDFDDVLDVPIQPQSGYQPVDETPPVPVFEDVFMPAQNQDQASPYDFPPYDKASAAPIGHLTFSAFTTLLRAFHGSRKSLAYTRPVSHFGGPEELARRTRCIRELGTRGAPATASP